MKKIILLFIVTFSLSSIYAQDIEKTDKQFEAAFSDQNLDAMLKILSPDCIIYGTDPSERWDVAKFRKTIENGLKNGMPTWNVISREILPINENSCVVIKKISWAIFKTELREMAIYEKQKDGWKMKILSINLTLPNNKTNAINEVMEKK